MASGQVIQDTCSLINDIGGGYTGDTNMQVNLDGSVASIVVLAAGTSNTARLRNWDLDAIPDGATIDAIKVAIYGRTLGGADTNWRLGLWYSGGVDVTNTNLVDNMGTTLGASSFIEKEQTVAEWGISPTKADLTNTIDFGIQFFYTNNSASTETYEIDGGRVTVSYTTSDGSSSVISKVIPIELMGDF